MKIAEVFTDGKLGAIYGYDSANALGLTTLIGKQFAPPLLGYFEAPAEVEPGWTYQDGRFTPPPEPEPPSLDEAKAVKRDELKALRDSVIAEGFSYGGHVYPLDSDVQLSLLTRFTGSQIVPERLYSWKDKDGIYQEIGDVTAFQAFAMAAMMYGQPVYAREEMLQAHIKKLGAPEAVMAVTWETVPDEPV